MWPNERGRKKGVNFGLKKGLGEIHKRRIRGLQYLKGVPETGSEEAFMRILLAKREP